MRVKNNQRAGNKKRTACSHASANKNTVAQLQENFFPPPRFNQTTKRSSFWCFGIKARTPAQPAGRESLKTPVQHLVLISESFLIWDKVRKKRKYGKRDRKRDIVHDKQYALWLSFSLLSIKLKIITSRQMDQECVYEQTDTRTQTRIFPSSSDSASSICPQSHPSLLMLRDGSVPNPSHAAFPSWITREESWNYPEPLGGQVELEQWDGNLVRVRYVRCAFAPNYVTNTERGH